MTSNIPYSFVPGTKAKAEEVNADFIAVVNKIDSLKIDLTSQKSDINLSNLSSDAEKHFINKTQVTNCILEAPNGIATYSNNLITFKSGLKVLIPNGRSTDGTLNNIEYTLPADLVQTSAFTAQTPPHFMGIRSNDNGATWGVLFKEYATQYFIQNTQPSVTEGHWYNPDTNLWKYISSLQGVTTWTDTLVCPIGIVNFSSAGVIGSISTFNTVDLLKRSDAGEIVRLDEPDFTKGASKSYDTLYTAEQDGWVWFASETYAAVNYTISNHISTINSVGNINGVSVFLCRNGVSWDGSANTVTNYSGNHGLYRIYKGQTYNMYSMIAGSAYVTAYSLIFYPLKGAK